MCDTLVAVGPSGSENGVTVFGKNSDRPSDEAQLVVFLPAEKHSPSHEVNCTHIHIPQVSRTAAVLLSQPYWMWGGEMGANEHGVVIGNEAVWTTEPLLSTGLLGMDLVRLGLERGKCAEGALNVITDLLERHGQGGLCTIDGSMNYHNSFIIADRKEAWVLETAGPWWVAERITDGVRNISNGLSITSAGDLRREGLVDHAMEGGLLKDEDDFNFAAFFSAGGFSPRMSPYSREGRCRYFLEENRGDLNPELFAEILRDHEAGVCMHGAFLSTGSQISVLGEDFQRHWFTGTGPTCESVFHPFEFDERCVGLSLHGPHRNINGDWIWFKHRQVFAKKFNDARKREMISRSRSLERDNFTARQKKRMKAEEVVELHETSWRNFTNMIGIGT